MLFSTMIPSVINLLVGSAALLRGLPLVTRWVLRRMPPGKAMRERDRLLVAGVLAGQLAGGALLTGAVLYGLIACALPLGLPALGGVIRDFSEQLAAYNAPARLIKWLAGAP